MLRSLICYQDKDLSARVLGFRLKPMRDQTGDITNGRQGRRPPPERGSGGLRARHAYSHESELVLIGLEGEIVVSIPPWIKILVFWILGIVPTLVVLEAASYILIRKWYLRE